MRPHASPAAGIPGALAVAFLFLAGCSTHVQPTAPESRATSSLSNDAVLEEPTSFAPGGLLVDLRPGRVTRLDRVFRISDVDGIGLPIPSLEVHSVVEVRITESVVHGGRTYWIEETTVQEEGEPTLPYTTLPMRQDRSGLYFYQPEMQREARPSLELGEDATALALPRDLASVWAKTAGRPAAWRATLARRLQTIAYVRSLVGGAGAGGRLAAPAGGPMALAGPPGGAFANEVTLLRYPLRPGASWDGLPGFNVWTVEAVGNVQLPVGRMWVSRLDISLPGITDADDKITYWYGAPGEVKHVQHFLDTATDQDGNPIGQFISEDEAIITSYTPGIDDPS